MTNMPPLILASTSPYRRELLKRLGLPFTCERPEVDERDFPLSANSGPVETALQLSVAKAESVSRRFPIATVIGSDQVVALGDEILHKPGNRQGAVEQLGRLAGKTHQIFTAVAIRGLLGDVGIAKTATLTMRALTIAEIERYVAIDEPYDCAGAYKFECAGITLFSDVATDDPTTITGLPLIWLMETLRRLGYSVP